LDAISGLGCDLLYELVGGGTVYQWESMTKQRKFVREYLKHFSATKAAIAVGCSERSAGELGHRLLKKVEASGLLAQETEKALSESGIEKKPVLEEIAKLAFSNMGDYVTATEDGQFDLSLSAISREKWAAIQEITVDTTGGSGDGERRRVLRTRFKLASKKENLELLAKYLQLLTDRKEVQIVGKDGGPIQTAIQVQFVTPDAANG
jgi:phage terminase small subunit